MPANVVIPEALLSQLTNVDWNVRNQSLTELGQLLKGGGSVAAYLPGLARSLCGLLREPNFIVVQSAFPVLELVVLSAGAAIASTVSFLVPALVEKLGDSKIVIRQSARDLLHALLVQAQPATVMDILTSKSVFYKESLNAVTMREEILLLIIREVLTGEVEIDVSPLPAFLVALLERPEQERVKWIATEALVLLHQSRWSQVESAVRAGNLRQDEVAALFARLHQGRPPFLNEHNAVQFRPMQSPAASPQHLSPAITPPATAGPGKSTAPLHASGVLASLLPMHSQAAEVLRPLTGTTAPFKKSTSATDLQARSPSPDIVARPANAPPPQPVPFKSYSASQLQFLFEPSQGLRRRGSDAHPPDVQWPSDNNAPPRTDSASRSLSSTQVVELEETLYEIPSGRHALETPTRARTFSLLGKLPLGEEQLPSIPSTPGPATPGGAANSPKLFQLKRRRANMLRSNLSTAVGNQPGNDLTITTLDSPLPPHPAQITGALNAIAARERLLMEGSNRLQSAVPRSFDASPEAQKAPDSNSSRLPTAATKTVRPSPTPQSVRRALAPLTPHPSEGSSKTKEQADSASLAPLPSPEKDLKVALEGLRSAEWEVNFDSLDLIRRLAIHHPDTLQTALHTVVLSVVDQSDNLRSGVARNAIVCLTDVYDCMPRQAEAELDFVLPKIMKRFCESSGFILKEADKLLACMSKRVTPARLFSSLMNHASHKHVTVRCKAATYMHACIESMSLSDLSVRDLERFLPILSSFIADSNAETRNYGRRCAAHLLRLVGSLGSMETLLHKFLPDSQVRRVMDAVQKQVSAQTSGRPEQASPSLRRLTTGKT